jgi:lipopolysaccharide/colanic/teichoic acid biosynthesis glycosyltransferase
LANQSIHEHENAVRSLGLRDKAGTLTAYPQEQDAQGAGMFNCSRELELDSESNGSLPPLLRRTTAYAPVKRIIDVVVAFVGIVLLLPLLPIIALLIILESPGPVFFADNREGRGGKDFSCLKFRTMRRGADKEQRELYAQNEMDGPQFKSSNDPRITRVGRWLRLTNLDELPQLVNVLFGQMSLVGPRPSPFRENQICLPWRAARLSVRPGITGLWQICRSERAESDFDQWIYYDILYARHLSFSLDAKILLHTLLSLGGRKHVSLHRLIPPGRTDHSH